MLSLRQKLIGLWKNFASDIRGVVLFYVTATLPVLIGFSLLAVDASRLMTLHTSLQKGVDAMAIAAAGELDHLPDAILRANTAVEFLVANKQLFGQGAPAITINDVTIRFYTDLPADDSDPMPNSGATLLAQNVSSNDFIANFVEVTVGSYTMNSIFPASFVGGVNQGATAATAVAGNTVVACAVAPLWICNPWEAPGNTDIYETGSIYNGTDTRAERRRQIRMREGPGGSGYGPGNYGFLIVGANGANTLGRNLAVGRPDTCFVQAGGVDFKTGQNTGPVEDGMNSRFGIYPNSNKIADITGADSDDRTRPALNVRSGQDQGANKLCVDYTPHTDTTQGQPLPKDGCFVTDTCGGGIGPENIGDGVWGETEMNAYWDANFPDEGAAGKPAAGNVGEAITDPQYQTEGPAQNWDSLTRYDIYRHEISQMYTDEEAVGGEYGDPTQGSSCWKGSPLDPSDQNDRRVVTGAILNCGALIADGRWGALNGAKVGVPPAIFAQFFITEPLEKGGSGNAGDIYSELVRVVQPGNNVNSARDQVQLYR